jgi:hypothetical protein
MLIKYLNQYSQTGYINSNAIIRFLQDGNYTLVNCSDGKQIRLNVDVNVLANGLTKTGTAILDLTTSPV